MAEQNNFLTGKSANGVVSTLYTVGNSLICASTIANLEDVNSVAPATNQTLVYNSSNSKWENKSLRLDTLADVQITTPAHGDKLLYSSALTKWINTTPYYYSVNIHGKIKESGINGYTAVNLLNPANYDVYNEDISSNGLTFDGTNYGITGWRTSGTLYKVEISLALSITAITNSSSLTLGNYQSPGSSLFSSTQLNITNNPMKTYNISSVKSFGTSAIIYPGLLFGSAGSPSYTGNVNGDISLSVTYCEC